ncbi:MAG TPA: hypothetical protein VHK91_06690 [Flavisolibacter sp.]|jgi:hypothetical protein|nr:hypothetical protein [Flavisolibacter sp.]
MSLDTNSPNPGRDPKKGQPSYDSFPDMTPRREGGDDALAESSPIDTRSDEKVIVNEQRSEKVVNAPSGSSADSDEINSNDE